VFLIVDNHPVHRSKAVAAFVDSTGGALGLYLLPAYSPQLNPDEWVWKNVKHDGVAPAAPKGPEQMKAVVTARLRRLQRLPQTVCGFFGAPELAYITAVG
jgi:transposase